MAVLLIPTTFPSEGDPYVERVLLEGAGYRLRFVYNSRDLAWYIDVKDDEDVGIITGRRITTNTDILKVVADITRRPPGALGAVALNTMSPQEPTLDTFGSSIPLLYVESGTEP